MPRFGGIGNVEDTMDWITASRALADVALPAGYRFELIKRNEVDKVARAVRTWFPEIAVGAASCFLRRDFLRERVVFPGTRTRNLFVVLLKKGCELAGLFSCEGEAATLTMYARLGVIAPEHRGARLGYANLVLAEALARRARMGLVYGMATLRVPHVQRAFEALGWQLVGIAPGFDREMIAPGVVKRVYEAVYAKVLAAEAGMQKPRFENLTARTRRFFRLMLPGERLHRPRPKPPPARVYTIAHWGAEWPAESSCRSAPTNQRRKKCAACAMKENHSNIPRRKSA